MIDSITIRQQYLNRQEVPELCKDCSYPRKKSWTTPFFWK